MSNGILQAGTPVLAFGTFRLLPVQRVLLEGDQPIRLGSRAFEILFALIERSGDVVGKEELIARVWPNTVVEEATLRVHIAALRKVLGSDSSGRYVENVSGRGYRFVAPVTRLGDTKPTPVVRTEPAERRSELPAPCSRVIGRADVVRDLAERLPQRRFVTVVGPGGIGKTTVAVATAERLAPSYEQGACFVDLLTVMDHARVPATLAAALGLVVPSDDPMPEILAFLAQKHVMIVLDTTNSMQTSTDNNCGLGANATREQCALAGVQTYSASLCRVTFRDCKLDSVNFRNGTLTENGVGKFSEINDAALESLRAAQFTHLWLTGIFRQATATDYAPVGLPADDPDHTIELLCMICDFAIAVPLSLIEKYDDLDDMVCSRCWAVHQYDRIIAARMKKPGQDMREYQASQARAHGRQVAAVARAKHSNEQQKLF